MQLMTEIAHVTDTNGQDLGSMPISVVFDTAGPMQVRHNGKSCHIPEGDEARELIRELDSRLSK
jgi:hypothetical protein